jgi:gluconokinase
MTGQPKVKTIVVMGVSGCGKSTVAQALAHRIGGEFLDADDFHPPANVAKMAAGTALSDDDRWPWLATLAHRLLEGQASGNPVVLACSALKEAYRDVLRVNDAVRFLYLKGTPETIEARMRARQGHFMKAGMLESQFATLEEPACGPGTDGWLADIGEDPQTIAVRAAQAFGWDRSV